MKFEKKITMIVCVIINIEESLKTLVSITYYLKVADWSDLNPRGFWDNREEYVCPTTEI